MSRRELLARGAKGSLALAALGLTGPTIFAAGTGVTKRPYWVEELLIRSDIRSDPATGVIQPGYPLRLNLILWQYLATTQIIPLRNALVDIWHANSMGYYSDEAMQNTLGQKFLRGTQVSNAAGKVAFTTIYPGWYTGRTPHVHFRVRVVNPATGAVSYNFVSQVFFNDNLTNDVYGLVYPYNVRPVRDTINNTDGIYMGASTDDELTYFVGSHLMLSPTNTAAGLVANFNVVIDLNDAGYNNPTGGGAGGPGGGPPGGGPPPGF